MQCVKTKIMFRFLLPTMCFSNRVRISCSCAPQIDRQCMYVYSVKPYKQYKQQIRSLFEVFIVSKDQDLNDETKRYFLCICTYVYYYKKGRKWVKLIQRRGRKKEGDQFLTNGEDNLDLILVQGRHLCCFACFQVGITDTHVMETPSPIQKTIFFFFEICYVKR